MILFLRIIVMNLINNTTVKFESDLNIEVNAHTPAENEEAIEKFISNVRATIATQMKTLTASKLPNATIWLSFKGDATSGCEISTVPPIARKSGAKTKTDKK